MRDWIHGNDEWHPVAFKTDGKLYGIPAGLMFSFPCTSKDGKYYPVQGLNLNDEVSELRIKKNIDDLISERLSLIHI